MRITHSLPALALAAALSLPTIGHAVEFKTVHTDKSALGFVYKQMGVGMEGHFKKFSAQLSFDPAKPAAAKASMDVELASIDAGSPEANDEVGGKSWFNTKAFPTARFVTSAIKPLGGNRYEVSGQLSIKGRSVPVVAPTTVTIQGKQASFDGSFVIKRADFAIGEGQWADFGIVANDIQIKFRMLASSQ